MAAVTVLKEAQGAQEGGTATACVLGGFWGSLCHGLPSDIVINHGILPQGSWVFSTGFLSQVSYKGSSSHV